ncbi:FAD-dependent oxidoreductase [Rhodococcus aetherivorans]|uniref:FAD-dependent oxidoreductase n=1 Tax=unclassified Rhodococcus (in: high G+C Gram-positive bacteria) TaxID=192944 RepID=UPI000B12A809|nr:FAD-dependent oxidoreductase [Rhodococcus sp. M8]
MATDVVVLGAGYAGVMAANRMLAAHPEVSVTVVNPRPVFVERVRLHQLAAGSGAAAHDLAEVLHPAAVVHLGTAVQIGADRVLLADGTALPFDVAIYAVGSGAGVPAIPGADRLHSPAEFERAMDTAAALDGLGAGAGVVVVGGGLTGVESAAEIAEAHPHLTCTLVGDPVAHLPGATRRFVAARLRRLGVRVRPGRVVAVTGREVLLADGEAVPAELTIWAGGFTVPDLARRSGLPVDGTGRLRVDATLRSTGAANVVGVGDAVTVDGQDHIRMSCQAALPLGAHGADTAWALLAGLEPQPLSLGFVAQCISLGRASGVVQRTRPDDTARGGALRGTLGAFGKEMVVRGTVWTLRRQARGHGYPFPKGPAAAHDPIAAPR